MDQQLILLLIENMESRKYLLGKRKENEERLRIEASLPESKWYRRLFFWRKTDPLEEKYEGEWLPPIEHLRYHELLMPWIGVDRAFKRCLSEELNVNQEQIEKAGKYKIRFQEAGRNYRITAYLLKPESGTHFTPNFENKEFRYFNPSEIRQVAPQDLLPFFDSLMNNLTSNQTNGTSFIPNSDGTEPYSSNLFTFNPYQIALK